jgi:RNA polymerase sigma factor (sigma-70 family)
MPAVSPAIPTSWPVRCPSSTVTSTLSLTGSDGTSIVCLNLPVGDPCGEVIQAKNTLSVTSRHALACRARDNMGHQIMGKPVPEPEPDESEPQQTTADLIVKVRDGDRAAENEIVRRNLPDLRRYAHGRLPHSARERGDTDDLVQDTMLKALPRLGTFDSQRTGAFQSYLRVSLKNHVTDAVRRSIRRPPGDPLIEVPDRGPSAIETLSIAETEACYRRALKQLRPGDRALVIAHVEREWTAPQIAKVFSKPSVDAARVAVSRAMQRLVREMQKPRST